MCSIENANFTRSIRCKIVYKQYVEGGVIEGERLSHVVRSFDHPKMIGLRHNGELVVEACTLTDILVAGNNPVDQCVAKHNIRVHPAPEINGKFPKVDVSVNDGLQRLTVFLDQLTRQECQTFRRKSLVPMIEKRRYSSGKIVFVVFIEDNPGFGCIRNNKFEIGVL